MLINLRKRSRHVLHANQVMPAQARSQVLSFGGPQNLFRGGKIFVCITVYKKIYGHKKFWGEHKHLGSLSPNAPRSYRPVPAQQEVAEQSRESHVA